MDKIVSSRVEFAKFFEMNHRNDSNVCNFLSVLTCICVHVYFMVAACLKKSFACVSYERVFPCVHLKEKNSRSEARYGFIYFKRRIPRKICRGKMLVIGVNRSHAHTRIHPPSPTCAHISYPCTHARSRTDAYIRIRSRQQIRSTTHAPICTNT